MIVRAPDFFASAPFFAREQAAPNDPADVEAVALLAADRPRARIGGVLHFFSVPKSTESWANKQCLTPRCQSGITQFRKESPMKPNDFRLIRQIADRAVDLYRRIDAIEPHNERFMQSGVIHELVTVHTEIVPLRLAELLAAGEDNFAHDIAGIHRHLEDGKKPFLADGFYPRFAEVQP